MPFSKLPEQTVAMILYVQPVPDIAAISVDRHRPSFYCIQGNQWNQFLRKLPRPELFEQFVIRTGKPYV